MKEITGHNQPFEPTYPNPCTEEEKRSFIAEARALHRSGYMPHDSWPLPEFYAGQYEDWFGLAQDSPEQNA
jgi:hypothetical protein